MTAAIVEKRPVTSDRKQDESKADQNIAKLISKSRYQTPNIVSFPLSGVGELDNLSMVGNVSGSL